MDSKELKIFCIEIPVLAITSVSRKIYMFMANTLPNNNILSPEMQPVIGNYLTNIATLTVIVYTVIKGCTLLRQRRQAKGIEE